MKVTAVTNYRDERRVGVYTRERNYIHSRRHAIVTVEQMYRLCFVPRGRAKFKVSKLINGNSVFLKHVPQSSWNEASILIL